MHTNYDVAKLLRFIKTLPIAISIIFSVILTYVVLSNNYEKHKENLISFKKEYIEKEKLAIKKEVLRTLDQINYQKDIAEEKLKNDVKRRVTVVSKIIQNIHKENKHKSKKEITKLIKDAIRPIRFSNGKGYFFIYDMKGTNILYPVVPKLEGKNFWDQDDLHGGYSIRKLTNIAKTKGEGFLSWYWFKPAVEKKYEKEMFKKIGYVKYIKELDWFVGTGEYVDEFEDKIKQDLIKEIQQIRFGENGYIFIHKYDGTCLSHINKDFIGTNQSDLKDSQGDWILKKVFQVAVNGGGYVQYESIANPLTNLSEQKLSYVTVMRDWKWTIGAGAYLGKIESLVEQKEAEFQNKISKDIIRISIFSIVFTIVLIFVMLRLLKRIEGEFKKYEDSLEQQIEENHEKDKLLSEQAKLASMGEMIGNIAHQWRQPLSVISTAATGMKMQKEYGCLSDKIFENTCDAINNNAQYLSRTIDDFKNFIKGDSTSKQFNITHSINSFLTLVESSVKAHEINIVLDLEDKLVILGHENELTQCLMNIYNNSKDALVQKDKLNKEFYITTKKLKHKERVRIEVKDNAGGIKEDILPHIFEPYFTTKHKSQGTGLGLHMTYNLIVQGMRGTIEASNIEFKDSKNNKVKGALFTIELPMK